MAARLVESMNNPTNGEDKDPWPSLVPAPGVWSGHTAQQWAAHTAAFDPRGFGGSDRVPMLTVVSNHGQS